MAKPSTAQRVVHRYAALEPHKIEIEVYGPDAKNAALAVLKFLRYMGDVGSSRALRTDENEKTITFWDGDGADTIRSIRLDGEEVETSKEERDDFAVCLR